MKTGAPRALFAVSRFFVRLFVPRHRVGRTNEAPRPAVYIVHHQNLRGPLVTMAWFDVPVRLWTLSVFCDRAKCFRWYRDYTFSVRFGLPKPLAAILAYPVSFYIAALMRSMETIPVHRGTREVVTTIRESVRTLAGGRSLLISPDIEYTDTGSAMGEMYDGFLDLEKYYLKRTGRHLAFVPLRIDRSGRRIRVGEPVRFTGAGEFRHDKRVAYERLKREFARLEREPETADRE